MTRLLLALGAATLFSVHLPVLANDDDNGHHGRDRVKFECLSGFGLGEPGLANDAGHRFAGFGAFANPGVHLREINQ